MSFQKLLSPEHAQGLLSCSYPPSIPQDTWELLAERLLPARRQKMHRVAQERTQMIRLVIQDVHDPHNIAACLRSAEAFGVLNIDVISTYQKHRKSEAARGTANWLRLHHWDNIKDCARYLKSQGFQIAAGYPNPDAQPLVELPVQEPVAVIFGNEHQGVSEDWQEFVDLPFTIPMCGMVESLNISVSAALSMYELTRRSRIQHSSHYLLSETSCQQLLGEWIYQQTPHATIELNSRRQRQNQ